MSTYLPVVTPYNRTERNPMANKNRRTPRWVLLEKQEERARRIVFFGLMTIVGMYLLFVLLTGGGR